MMNWVNDPSSFYVGLCIGGTGGLMICYVRDKSREIRKRYRRWKELRHAAHTANGGSRA